MKKLTLLPIIVVLACLSAACGSNPIGPDPITGGITPTPTPVATPVELKLQQGNNFNLPSPGSGTGFTIMDIPSAGTVKITVTWSFEDSTIGIYLLNQPGCYQTSTGGWTTSAKDISEGTCPTLIGAVVDAKSSTRTTEITRQVSAGRAYLRLSNQRDSSKGGGESGSVKVVFLPQ
jgi:hypothetical protein